MGSPSSAMRDRLRPSATIAALATALLSTVLVVGCGREEGPSPGPADAPATSGPPLAPSPAATDVPAEASGEADGPAAEAAPASAAPSESAGRPDEPGQGPPSPPLEKLLELPPSIVEAHQKLEIDDPDAREADPADPTQRRDRRVRLRVDSREEPLGVDHSRKRQRTDAGVAVGVDDDTSIRGGVRVEQESERRMEDPVPTVGIEGRF